MMRQLPFSKGEIERSIPDRFNNVVENFAQRTAIKSGELNYSYKELNNLAIQLAQSIISKTGNKQEPVILVFDREAAVAPAILGVLKAGKAYVALDPDYPPTRSRYLLSDLQTRLLITNNRNLQLSETLAQGMCQVINLDQLEPDELTSRQTISVSPGSLAAVFYTSGTTGQPKGVERSHQFILHRVWFESNDYNIQADDNFSLIHHFSFGASQVDIFNALLNGATLCLYDIRENGVDGLVSWLKHEQITFFHAPSDLFRRFIDHLTENDQFPALRQITPSGRLYRQDIINIRKHIPDDCLLIQRLASTETGIITRIKIDKHSELNSNVIPVGYPIEDKEVFILDETGKPVGFDCMGEIAVKSRYLASGYWGRPDQTQKAFQSDPNGSDRKIFRLGDIGRMSQDGCLELVGRKDSQVKIRGYRVELGEVEAALLNLEGIKETAVIVQEQEPGEYRLVAYIVLDDSASINVRSTREALSKKLPEYMIPAIFILLDILPLTDRNKLDYKALPDPGYTRPLVDESYVAPQTTAELALAEVWSEVLHIEPIGIHDNFFELGGHSLLAAQIVSRTSTLFDVNIPLRTIIDFPTISGFAQAIEKIASNQAEIQEETLKKYLRLLGYL